MFFPLVLFERGVASHFFMSYMGVRTCSHKTIYDIKELPKARKAQADCGVRFLLKPCLIRTCCQTIFAFLTLNTPRSAHKEIIGAKFSSFERAAIAYWCTDGYTAKKVSVQWMMELNKHNRGTIEPLYHSNTASVVIQKSLSSTPTAAVLEWKRGFSYILWGQRRCQTPQKRPNKSLKPIFIL